jgi:hypothetical protein
MLPAKRIAAVVELIADVRAAVIETNSVLVTVCGAMYSPFGHIVPMFADHVTFGTLETYCWLAPGEIDGQHDGVMEI